MNWSIDDAAQLKRPTQSFYADSLSRVLLVEDEPIFGEIWKYILKTMNKSVELTCVDSIEGAEKLISSLSVGVNHFDLVISDLYVSGAKNGIDFWKERFLSEVDPAPPFILVSSLSISHLLKGLKGTWAIPTYIQKPFDPSECVPVIKSVLGHRQRLI